MLESYFTCPYCWENQLKMVDPSLSTQTYIEDCEVCCNPIEFHINITDDELVQITPISIEQ
ncbi:MAG: CPXCG motif-containing cysteine-rich protein [Flavobacteriaceae bacterium]|nr:CPXCG motif-containing cysteine-rich protein [Flavobacteriaceae bacterium]